MKKTAEKYLKQERYTANEHGVFIYQAGSNFINLATVIDDYSNTRTAPLIEALEYITSQVKKLTTDMPEVCYINPLLLACVSESETALLNAKGS